MPLVEFTVRIRIRFPLEWNTSSPSKVQSVRIAYLDCSTGISGDMTLAALIDAGVDAGAIRAGINSLGLPGVGLVTENVMRCAFRAVHVRVEHPEQHAHRHLHDIVKIIDGAGRITARQKELAKRIFHAVAEAEAKVHGSTVEKIHFHEVGAIDSIVDIVGAAIGFDLLGVESLVSSPVPTGRGQVRIAHGVCSVPTPGTAELLKGIPLVNIPIDAELTTPTGAAILTTLVDRFGPMPDMTVEQIGYGAGTKDFPDRANTLRLFVGQSVENAETDLVCLLETNLDDVPGEVIGYTKQKLLAAGALDVFSTAIQMKKDRPATIVSVICRPVDRERLESILFDETSTFGIRRHLVERVKRTRRECEVQTPWGIVQGKLGWHSGGTPVFTPEFESCARVASAKGIALRDVYRAAESAYAQQQLHIPPTTPLPHDAQHDHRHDHDHDHDHDHRHDHDHDHDHRHDHDH